PLSSRALPRDRGKPSCAQRALAKRESAISCALPHFFSSSSSPSPLAPFLLDSFSSRSASALESFLVSVPQLKSSNSVVLSALVQTPTFPASLKVLSFHTKACLPSNVTTK